MITTTKKAKLQIDSLAPAMAELERALIWGSRDIDNLAVPIVPVIQTRGKKARCLGWFRPNGWSTKEGESRHEVSFSAETLDRDPVDIIATAIHELVHVWCSGIDVKDTAGSGRHNKQFKEYAGLMGLDCLDPVDSYGYGYTSPTPELRERIAKEFEPDYAAFNLFRLVKPPKPSKTKMKKYTCMCTPKPRIIRCAYEDLAARCEDCQEDFVMA
jgi:hypothetical protein